MHTDMFPERIWCPIYTRRIPKEHFAHSLSQSAHLREMSAGLSKCGDYLKAVLKVSIARVKPKAGIPRDDGNK